MPELSHAAKRRRLGRLLSGACELLSARCESGKLSIEECPSVRPVEALDGD